MTRMESPWFSMSTTPTRSGWFNVQGRSTMGERNVWPGRMWFDAEHDRWMPAPHSSLKFNPTGAYFRGTRWQGRLMCMRKRT